MTSAARTHLARGPPATSVRSPNARRMQSGEHAPPLPRPSRRPWWFRGFVSLPGMPGRHGHRALRSGTSGPTRPCPSRGPPLYAMARPTGASPRAATRPSELSCEPCVRRSWSARCPGCLLILFLTICGSGRPHCCHPLPSDVTTIPDGCAFLTEWHSPPSCSCCGQVSRGVMFPRRRGDHVGPSPVDRARPGSKHHLIVDRHGPPSPSPSPVATGDDVTQLLPLLDAVPPVRGLRGR